MRDLDSLSKEHKNQLRDERPWVWLYEVEVPSDPVTWLRVTNYSEPIPHHSTSAGAQVLFQPAPIAHGGWTQSKEGDLPTFSVQVGNASHGGALPGDRVSDLFEEYDGLVGQSVKVTLLNIQAIDSEAGEVEFVAEISRSRSRIDVVGVELTTSQIFQSLFPPYRFTSQHCRHRFGDIMCGYVIPTSPTDAVGGGFSFCPKTLEACEERGEDEDSRGVTVLHPLRWGGFAGIPRQ